MSNAELYEKLAERIFCKGSKIIPQLFAMIADEEEAKTLLAMPGTVEELAQKMGTSVEEMQKRCDTLYHKGLAFKSFKGQTLGYKMCRELVQFHDATILWPEAPREYHDLWQKYMEEEWPSYAKMIAKMMPKPFTRIIPAGVDLAQKQQVLPFESIKDIIESASRIAVTKCTCRLIAKKCDKPLEVCLQINRGADYTIDRGSGREVSKEEAMEIIRQAEEAGLIHVTMNKADVGHFICNCCDDCCQTFPVIIHHGINITDPSRFRAQVDAESCEGCQTCIDRCYFKAITMVEHDGKEVARVIEEKCMGCGLCRTACPSVSISLVEVRDKSFIPGAS
jgi:ferredoxin